MLFHGLGGKHADMEPLATPSSRRGLRDARVRRARPRRLGGLFGLDGPATSQDTQELFTWLAGRGRRLGHADRRARHLARRRRGLERAVAGVPFKAIVPVITWTNLAPLSPRGPPEVRPGRDALPGGARELGSGARPAEPALLRARTWRRSRARRVPLAARTSRAHADAADPGPPRLPLRHRPGARGVQGPRGAEAALPRRPRASAGQDPGERAPVYIGDASSGSALPRRPWTDGPDDILLAHDPWNPARYRPCTRRSRTPGRRASTTGQVARPRPAHAYVGPPDRRPARDYGDGTVIVRYSAAKSGPPRGTISTRAAAR